MYTVPIRGSRGRYGCESTYRLSKATILTPSFLLSDVRAPVASRLGPNAHVSTSSQYKILRETYQRIIHAQSPDAVLSTSIPQISAYDEGLFSSRSLRYPPLRVPKPGRRHMFLYQSQLSQHNLWVLLQRSSGNLLLLAVRFPGLVSPVQERHRELDRKHVHRCCMWRPSWHYGC